MSRYQVTTLMIGLMVGMMVTFFPGNGHGHEKPTDIQWEVLSEEDGITSEGGTMADSALKAFRGTALIEERIGLVISALYDHEHAPEWVEGLATSIELQNFGNQGILVWQRFNNPWPVSDRDFVYRAVPEYNEGQQTFRARFIDLDKTEIRLSAKEREMIPDSSCCVRGKIIHAEWLFRSIGPKSTCARIEVIMDPQGWVPAIFVNWFQRTWPHHTLVGLRKQVKKDDLLLHPQFGYWPERQPDAFLIPSQCGQAVF